MSSSLSTGTPGRSGSPGGISLPRPSPRFLVRAVLSFALCFGAWFILRPYYTATIVRSGADLLAKFADGMPADEMVRFEQGHYVLDTGLQNSDGSVVRRKLKSVHLVGWSSVYLAWIVCLTPLSRLRRYWWFPLLALGALWSVQVAYFSTNTAKNVGMMYHETFGESFLEPSTLKTLDVICRGYIQTLHHVLPFILYAPIFFFPMRERPKVDAAVAKETPRNAPCPCGSGRKFKRCCGAPT